MEEGTELFDGDSRKSAEALRALAESLEQALDQATSVILMRHSQELCTVYLGDPSGPREELCKTATISRSLADEMLVLTSSGSNRLQIGDQHYRFARTFTQVGETAAIVFSP
ncbi:hypothetical protein BHUM_01949 [Candidatus Burkholderia humilis]|nr:hypothetical protein BHUM_01949 [Candidatus Burkholderia humilis]